MKRIGRNMVACVAVLALALIFGGTGPAAAAPIKLTMVGSWPPKISSAADVGIRFLEEVNRRGKGKVVIRFYYSL